MTKWIELEQTFAFEVFPKRELVITKGKGARLWDDQGNEFIDCTAGVGVANVGHVIASFNAAGPDRFSARLNQDATGYEFVDTSEAGTFDFSISTPLSRSSAIINRL